jgi:hypothetical protein
MLCQEILWKQWAKQHHLKIKTITNQTQSEEKEGSNNGKSRHQWNRNEKET